MCFVKRSRTVIVRVGYRNFVGSNALTVTYNIIGCRTPRTPRPRPRRRRLGTIENKKMEGKKTDSAWKKKKKKKNNNWILEERPCRGILLLLFFYAYLILLSATALCRKTHIIKVSTTTDTKDTLLPCIYRILRTQVTRSRDSRIARRDDGKPTDSDSRTCPPTVQLFFSSIFSVTDLRVKLSGKIYVS